MRYLVLLLLLASPLAFAGNACVSQASGNWNSAATWTSCGSTFPGTGDSASIASGHTVTVASATSVAATGVSCTTTNGTGVLIVNGTLSVDSGGLNPCNSNWTINAGSTVHCTSATTCPVAPATGSSYLLTISGTAASHVTMDRTSTGTWGPFTTQLTANFLNLSYCGASGGYCMNPPVSTAASYFIVQHSSCDHCSTWRADSPAADARVAVTWSVFTNLTATNQRQFEWTNWSTVNPANPAVTYMRSLTNNYWERGLLLTAASNGADIGLSFGNNFCYGYGTGGVDVPCLNTLNGATPKFADGEWYNNIIYWKTTSGSNTSIDYLPAGTLRNLILLTSNPAQCPDVGSANNYNISFTPDGLDMSILGGYNQPDCGSPTPTGDTFIIHPNATLAHYTFKNIIHNGGEVDGMPNSFTTLVTGGSYPNCDNVTGFCPAVTVQNNTINVGNVSSSWVSGGLGGENGGTVSAATYTATDNIFFRPTSGACAAALWFGATTGLASGTWAATNNAIYNCSTNVYTTAVPAGKVSPAGTNDQTLNPSFWDSTRNFTKWCQSLDNTIVTWEDCRAKFVSQTAGFTPSALMDYMTDGFRPANATIGTMSTTGGHVGAIPLVNALVSAANLNVGDVRYTYSVQAQTAKGSSYTDSRFNVPVYRVTNAATDAAGAHPGGYITNYSTNNPLSNDGQYLIFPFCNSQDACDAQFSIFNASTFAWVKDIPSSSIAGWNGVNGEPRWDRSGSANNIIYYRKNTQLRSYNMTNDADSLVTDFYTAYGSGGNNQLPLIATTDFIYTGEKGNTTLNSRYWAFIVRDGATTFQDKYIVTYDIQNPSTLVSVLDISAQATITHDLDISPYSDYVLIGAVSNPYVCAVSNLSSCFTVDSGLPHNWWAKTAQGHTVLVGLDKSTDTEMMVRPDNQSFYLLYCQGNAAGATITSCQNTTHYLGYGNLGGKNGQNGDLVTSAPNVSGWAFLSTYAWNADAYVDATISFIAPIPPAGKIFGSTDFINYWSSNALFALELDETKYLATKTTYNGTPSYSGACTQGVNCPRIWQVAQLNNAVDNDYYFKQPNAVASFDGTKIWWGGNWRIPSGAMEVYQANLPSNWVSDLGGVSNGSIQTSNTIRTANTVMQ